VPMKHPRIYLQPKLTKFKFILNHAFKPPAQFRPLDL
jgi:hypothetical protein